MRRELKGLCYICIGDFAQYVAKHIPMRRELKDVKQIPNPAPCYKVAKHIPMRRELKDEVTVSGDPQTVTRSQSTSR